MVLLPLRGMLLAFSQLQQTDKMDAIIQVETTKIGNKGTTAMLLIVDLPNADVGYKILTSWIISPFNLFKIIKDSIQTNGPNPIFGHLIS